MREVNKQNWMQMENCCDVLRLFHTVHLSVCSDDISSVSSPLTHSKLEILCLFEFLWDV